MEKKKTSIKSLPQKEVSKSEQKEGGSDNITNRIVFTLFCKDVVDAIKTQIPKKPSSFKQIVAYSLASLDDETKRNVLELIKNNKAFDVVVEKWIGDNRKHVIAFFEKQPDKESNVSLLKARIAELEAKVGDKK